MAWTCQATRSYGSVIFGSGAQSISGGHGDVVTAVMRQWLWWSFLLLQCLPLDRIRVRSGEQRRRRTSYPVPLVPTSSLQHCATGAHQPCLGWTPPIRAWVKGPMSRWAHWWRDQPNILPLDLIIILLTLYFEITLFKVLVPSQICMQSMSHHHGSFPIESTPTTHSSVLKQIL